MKDRLAGASDATLALAVARYEQSALAELYRRHAGATFALARRLLNDATIAEDVVQEVFVRLWRDPTRFDPSRGSMRSFLLTQTHGRAVDTLRADVARRRREQRDARGTAEGGYDIELEVWDMARSEQVREALQVLPEEERRAISIAYFGGYTYREVAEQLAEPEGTVKSRIRTGLRRLREHFTATGLTTGDH